MSWFTRTLSSTIGSKLVVAVTGVALALFLVAHLAGNLQVFLGQDAFNAYAAKLKSIPAVLWGLRSGLIVVAVVHVIGALRLAQRNRDARPVRYAVSARVQSSSATHSMVLTGLLVLAFVIFHLAHFTWGLTHPEHAHLVDPEGRHDAFSMLVLGFQSVPVTISYVFAMGLLGLHVAHGLPSLFQSLGFDHPKYRPMFERGCPVLGAMLVAGFVAIPVSVMAGLVKLPPGVAGS